MNYKFSGHETFHCRPLWLKKGFDFANNGGLFTDNDAVIELGVGKNMVASIKFWLRAFGFYNLYNNELEGLADDLLSDGGFDPYLEDEATLFLLHYLLIQNVHISSIYHLVFLTLSKEKTEFSLENLKSFIRRECLNQGVEVNDKTLDNDIKVFLKNYIPSSDKKISIEDNYGGLFYDLRYLNKINSSSGEVKYQFNINDGRYLPEIVFLYVLLEEFKEETSINIETIREKVSSNFLMGKQGTYTMIERLVKAYPDMITFKDDGGRQELQIKRKLNQLELLRKYYGRV